MDVAVGGMGVAVGGTEVAVAGMDVAVGGTGVAVGGTGVAVGGTGVAVGGTDVGAAAGPPHATSTVTKTRATIHAYDFLVFTFFLPSLVAVGVILNGSQSDGSVSGRWSASIKQEERVSAGSNSLARQT
jgi:hypothetical protein